MSSPIPEINSGGIFPHALSALTNTIDSIPKPVKKCAKVALVVLGGMALGAAFVGGTVAITAIAIGGTAALIVVKPFILAGLAIGAAAALAGATVGGLILVAGYVCYLAIQKFKEMKNQPQSSPQQSQAVYGTLPVNSITDYQKAAAEALKGALTKEILMSGGIFRLAANANVNGICAQLLTGQHVDLTQYSADELTSAYKRVFAQMNILESVNAELVDVASNFGLDELGLRTKPGERAQLHVLSDQQIEDLSREHLETIKQIIVSLDHEKKILLNDLLQVLESAEDAQKESNSYESQSLHALAIDFGVSLILPNTLDGAAQVPILLAIMVRNRVALELTQS